MIKRSEVDKNVDHAKWCSWLGSWAPPGPAGVPKKDPTAEKLIALQCWLASAVKDANLSSQADFKKASLTDRHYILYKIAENTVIFIAEITNN